MGSDIQYHCNDIKDSIPSPQQLAHGPERPPVEHHCAQVQDHIGNSDRQIKRAPEFDLGYIINIETKDRIEKEQESPQPEMPAFSSPHQNDADDHCRDAQGVYKPAIFHSIDFKKGFPKGKMENEYNLKGEGPDDKQLVIIIKLFPSGHDFPPHISFI
jgi:hypothetical protein